MLGQRHAACHRRHHRGRGRTGFPGAAGPDGAGARAKAELVPPDNRGRHAGRLRRDRCRAVRLPAVRVTRRGRGGRPRHQRRALPRTVRGTRRHRHPDCCRGQRGVSPR
ncbi:hypothetical protein BFL43_14340 [Williamsia sp. 1135]|nr:hypothetical protein BFL43_14340 [Williamsia sp. 1135]